MSNAPAVVPEGVELTDGFHLLMDALELNGITNIYGLLGIPVTEIGRMWQARGNKFYSFRNEQNAGYAASVAGYLTKKPGVCVTVSAPGFLNGLTALANATTNCFPMILISGSSEREIVDLQQGDYEEMDQLNIARPHCKASFRINRPEDIGVAVVRAVRTALSGRPGGVYLDIPARLFSTVMSAEEGKKSLWAPVDPAPAQIPAPSAVQRAAELIKNAKKPLILFGKGAAYAQCDADILAFVEETGIPFTPMSMAKGLVSDLHPQCAAAARSMVLQESDVVVLVGARLNWLLAHGKGKTWGVPKKFIQIDIQANEIDSNVQIAAPLVGDVQSCINALRAELKGYKSDDQAAWAKAVAEKHNSTRAKLAGKLSTPTPVMNYHNSLGAIRDVLKNYPDICLVNEGANALDNARMVIDQYQPRKRVDTGTWGVMGIGMGSAAAAAVETGKPVVAICGDSAFGFSAMEYETLTRYNLPVTVIVMNNGGIYRGDEASPDHQFSCMLFNPNTRYDQLSIALGGEGVRVNTPEELAKALEASIKSGKTTIIDAIIDPAAGVESGRIGNLNIVSTIGKK
ncbi:MAG: oxalyl-CoA decarboxylase [Oxalicibacterium faecigallinarum]|uniref:oxalyl-CoA decarboxylase n=1 Tax=Oxalicibacterium faecigallinarum TaxID=573741 RepID=UPI002808FE3C|nr:oxalyl-CoA decarboxylase [Oxalicibacterium faecigallinarum]MDQ7970337.1 oxalyl-CoA decarboxylase [Oxalicibacterium faecigallinarum]